MFLNICLQHLQDGDCLFNQKSIGATVSGIVDISCGSESELMAAVATVGPVSVSIDPPLYFQFYSGTSYLEHPFTDINNSAAICQGKKNVVECGRNGELGMIE